MFKKRDLWLILALAAVAGGLLLLLPTLRGGIKAQDGETLYLRVSRDGVYDEPVALTEEKDIVIDQGDGKVNTIHVTPTSIVMASSTCHNQLCVQQGVVTADNAEQRPLYNMIVCAPHRLVLELLTAQEAGHGE